MMTAWSVSGQQMLEQEGDEAGGSEEGESRGWGWMRGGCPCRGGTGRVGHRHGAQ